MLVSKTLRNFDIRVDILEKELAMIQPAPESLSPSPVSFPLRPELTSREYEVLTLIAEGFSNKRVARVLDISPRTVSTHLTRIYGKLWVRGRTAAVVKAARLGLV